MDAYSLGFKESSGGVLLYSPGPRRVSIRANRTYDEWEKKMIEEHFEGLISHETVHAVLHEEIDEETCRSFDYLGEHVTSTPFSFPRGCE